MRTAKMKLVEVPVDSKASKVLNVVCLRVTAATGSRIEPHEAFGPHFDMRNFPGRSICAQTGSVPELEYEQPLALPRQAHSHHSTLTAIPNLSLTFCKYTRIITAYAMSVRPFDRLEPRWQAVSLASFLPNDTRGSFTLACMMHVHVPC